MNGEQNEDHRGERKRADDGSDCGIEVATGGIKPHDIQFSEHLESQAVVSEDNKAYKRAATAITIISDNKMIVSLTKIV